MNIYTSMHGIAKKEKNNNAISDKLKYHTVLCQVAHLLSTRYIRCVLMGIYKKRCVHK